MSALGAWLHRESRRERSIVVLEDALLGNRFPSYAAYRLRYFLLRLVAATAVQGGTFVFLHHVLPERQLLASLALYAVAALIGSFWWGVLEVLRRRVRELYRLRRADLISEETGRWLSRSVRLSILTLVGLAAWIAWRVSAGEMLNPAEFYALAVGLRLAAEFPARCYHSGAYAVRRIYRPAAAIVAVDALSFAGMLALWPVIGAWSFPAVAAVATVVVTAMTFHYTGRMYRLLACAPSSVPSGGRLTVTPRHSWLEGTGAGLSYAVMHMDALLMLALLGTDFARADGRPLFLLFFVLSPIIRGGVDWAQLFYFDLKRLDLNMFERVRQRFEAAMLWLGLILAFVFWAGASVTGTLVYGHSLGALYGLLVPFFVARSMLAGVQMQAFSRGRYARLLAGGAIFGVVLTSVALLSDEASQAFLFLSAGMFGVCAFLEWRSRTLRPGGVLWPSEWSARLRSVREPVRVTAVELFQRSPAAMKSHGGRERGRVRRHQMRLAEAIAGPVARRGGVTLMHPGRIVWYEPAGTATAVPIDWVLRRGQGLIRAVSEESIGGRGTACPAWMNDAGIFEGEPPPRGVSSQPVSADDVRRSFARMVPNGIVFDPGHRTPTVVDALPAAEKRAILGHVTAFVRGLAATAGRSRFDVTAWCHAGDVQLVFLIDRTVAPALRAEWTRTVRQYNMRPAEAERPASRPPWQHVSKPLSAPPTRAHLHDREETPVEPSEIGR